MKLFENEKAFTRWVLAEARKRGWKAAHLETYQVVRTPLGPRAVPSKNAKGFPDCVFAHPEHGFFMAELKMPRGQRTARARELSPEQVEWIVALRASGATVHVWQPHEQEEILGVLSGAGSSSRLFDQDVA